MRLATMPFHQLRGSSDASTTEMIASLGKLSSSCESTPVKPQRATAWKSTLASRKDARCVVGWWRFGESEKGEFAFLGSKEEGWVGFEADEDGCSGGAAFGSGGIATDGLDG